MIAKRILVLYRKSLLSQSVERLLRGRGKQEVMGVDLDQDKALESVGSFHPDVVLVDTDDLSLQTSGLLLRDNPDMKLICLRTTDAQVQVVSSQQIMVNNLRELLQVLEGG